MVFSYFEDGRRLLPGDAVLSFDGDGLAFRRLVISGVVIEQGIGEHPLRLAVFASKRKHASDPFDGDRAVRCEALRID